MEWEEGGGWKRTFKEIPPQIEDYSSEVKIFLDVLLVYI